MQTPPAGCRFSVAAGRQACRWIESNCTFTASRFAHKPFILQTWQVFFVMCVFGWLRGEARRFRHVHLWLPRKSGKSELAAAIGLFMLLADGEINPFVCSTASTEKQARIVPRAAWWMQAGFDEKTVGRYRVRRNEMTDKNAPVVSVDGGAGVFKALPKDISGSLDGLSPSCAVIDELHSYRSPHTYDAMAEGMGSRDRAILLVISTAGDIVGGIGQQQHDLAVSVLGGRTTKDDLFALVFSADRDLPIDDPATWRMANPSLGVTVSEDFVASRCAEALATGRQEAFRRKQLNQWPVDSADTWIDAGAWDACADGSVGKAGRRAWAGIGTTANGRCTALLWQRGGSWRAAIRFWEDDRTLIRWILRKARNRHLTVALDPARDGPAVGRLEGAGVRCVTVARRHLALPMRALADAVAAGAFRHRSPPAAARQVASMGVATLSDGWARPRADAAEAPLAVLNALAVGLADQRPVTMRDIPDWDGI